MREWTWGEGLAESYLRCFQDLSKVLVWDGIVLLLEAVLEGDLEPSWRCVGIWFGWSSGPGNAFRCRGVALFRTSAGLSSYAPHTAQDGPDGPPGRGTGGSLTGAFFEGFHGLKSGHFAGEGC